MPDFETYLSPFTWRYGTPAMRSLWSENNKRLLWRQVWVALAEAQAKFGLVTPAQVADLRAHQSAVDLPAALEIEALIQHDLMAELQLFASQCPLGGGILHLGATSMDIEDNADVLRLRQALSLLAISLGEVLRILATLVDEWADTPLMAFTHLQPAEPSTLGYRLAFTAQDLLADYQAITALQADLKGKGFKGAVGTSAAYAQLLGTPALASFEQDLSQKLGLPFFAVTSQVYPRRQDLQVVSALAGLGASLYKFAFDLRLLQSPTLGEISEPFGKKQVGSSAMPFKRNPVKAEKINSLARYLASLPRLAWDNAAHSLLERTLDDSANRRIYLPEACLATDEILLTTSAILSGLRVDKRAMARNLDVYAPFAATERLLMALVQAGADRQEMHERLRSHTMQAWEELRQGGASPLIPALCQDALLTRYLSAEQILALMQASAHLGDAPARARQMAATIRQTLPKKDNKELKE